MIVITGDMMDGGSSYSHYQSEAYDDPQHIMIIKHTKGITYYTLRIVPVITWNYY